MRKCFFFSFLFFASFSTPSLIFSQDCVDCGPTLKHATDLTAQIESLQKTAQVDCEDVKKKDVDAEYEKNFSKAAKKTSTVAGLKLSGTADELKFLKQMLGDKPTTSWNKAAECQTVLCALTKVYDSEENAKRVLNIAKRNGYIVSASRDFNVENKDVGQLFSADEITTIDHAYKKLPANFSKLKTLDKLKRMPDGYGKPGSPNAAAYARPGFKSSYYSSEGEIVFISSAFSTDKSWAPMVAVHELAHHLDFAKSDKHQFGISESPEFMKISGWKLEKKYETKEGKKVLIEKWNRPEDKSFVRDYAGTEPAEDFAEAVAYYVYEPEKLRELDPEKYEFIKKKIFAGQEFVDDIDLKVSKEQLLARCLGDSKKIAIYGGYKSEDSDSFSNCLAGFVKEFSITDPAMCFSNPDLIKIAALGKIKKELNAYNRVINTCDKGLKKFRETCHSENNFQKKCAQEKCNIPPELNKLLSFSPNYDDDKLALKAIKTKSNLSGYLTNILIAGLAEGKSIAKDYSLAHQKFFSDKATKEVIDLMAKENLKVDATKELEQEIYYDLVISKDTAPLLTSFQKSVLSKASKSKEKNLEMIKSWASSQSLEDSPQFETLAESLTKFGKN